MNIQLETLPDCKAQLRIEIPADTVQTERNGLLRAFTSQARIPGFRPGKAPKAVIQKRYQREIQDELQDRLVSKGYQDAIQEKELKVLGVNDVSGHTFHPDDTFTFEAQVILAPTIELPEYHGLELEIPKREVTQEHLDNTLERLRQNYATFDDIEDRALAMDDIAVITYQGKHGDTPISEAHPKAPAALAGHKDYWIKMEEGSFLPGFCNDLVGLETGQEKDLTVVLPEDFHLEELRGEELHYHVSLTGIKVQNLPELDDELAGKIKEGQSLQDLQDTIRQGLEEENTQAVETEKTNAVVRHLDQHISFEIPSEVLHEETQRQANEMATHAIDHYGLDEEALKENEAQIIDNATQQANLNVKTAFILEEIAKKEDIRATDDEVGRAVINMAMQSGENPKKYIKEMRKSGGIDRIHNNLRIQKTLEHLKEKANFTEIEAPEAHDSDCCSDPDCESCDDK